MARDPKPDVDVPADDAPAVDVDAEGVEAEMQTPAVDPDAPVEVRVQLGDEPPVTVRKPSGEYTQFVLGYGYKEIS